MPTCKNCSRSFSSKAVVAGKKRNLQNRRYCLECSPWGTRFVIKTGIATPLRKPAKYGNPCRLCGKPVKRKSKTRCQACDSLVRRIRNKLFAIAYLGGRCSICGFSKNPWSFVFHHTDEDTKEFTIGQASALKWLTLLVELKKCSLVCANCHMAHHSNRRRLDDAVLEDVKNYKGSDMDPTIFRKAIRLIEKKQRSP